VPSPLDQIVQTIERSEAVDALTRPLGKLSKQILRRPRVTRVLEGVSWLSHPLHPVLTDYPIGFWTSALALDLMGSDAAEGAADTLVGLGIVAAVPTAAAGLAEYGRVGPPTIRVAAAHAAANSVALSCQAASWAARRAGARGAGKALSLLALAALSVGGYLGGHMAYGRAVGVDQRSETRAAEASGSIAPDVSV
jgi:uncharacterized membrane protein